MQGRFRRLSIAGVLAASLSLSACGGGGGSSSPVPSGGTGSGSGSGTGSGGGTTSTAHAPATVTLSFLQYQPVQISGARRTAFISPATKNIKLGVVSSNGTKIANPTYTTIPVGPTATGCTSTGAQVTCTASIDAPVGSDVISVTALDQSFAPLGTTLAPASIALNANNVVPLAIGGTVANLKIFLTTYTFAAGASTAPGTSLIIVVPLDPSGAVIVNPGNYNPPITVSLTGGGPAFSLLLDGAASGSSATLASPSDQAVLNFAGSPTSVSTTITAQAGTVTAQTSAYAYAPGIPGLSVTPSGTNLVTSTTQFVFPGTTGTGTLTASGGTGPYTASSNAPSIATVSSSGSTFTITPVGVGSATITVQDSSATPQTYSIPVTVTAGPILIATTSCGSAAACSSTSISFPPYGSSGVVPQETGTISLSGGTGTFSYYFASSGTTTSSYANVSASGNAFTITPIGSGNDTLIFSSGGQYAAYGILTTTTSPLAALLPSKIGMFIIQNAGGVGKQFTLALPTAVTSLTQLSGPTDENLLGPPASPGSMSATPMTPGSGTFRFADAKGNTADVPFTMFGLTFGTYAGTGRTSPTESPTGTPADEQFTAIGQMDQVTVAGPSQSGVLPIPATSSNTNVVTVVSAPTTYFVVTAVGAGTATITVTDPGNFATITYTVSVTTTTIPIAGHTHER